MDRHTVRQSDIDELVEAMKSLESDEEIAEIDGQMWEDYLASRQRTKEAFSKALAGALADAIVSAAARGASQADVAALYHEMLWLPIGPYDPAWRKAGEAIRARWPKGFNRVKERAWKLYDQVSEATRRARAEVEGFDVAGAS